MKITVAQLMVIIDTMNGAAQIADRADYSVFSFTRETRARVLERIVAELNKVELDLHVVAAPGEISIEQEPSPSEQEPHA